MSAPSLDLACARLCADAYDPAIPPDEVVGAMEVYVKDLDLDGRRLRLVGYRGSDPKLLDWVTNAAALPQRVLALDCLGHFGFTECAFQSFPVVARLFRRAEADGRQVVVTGHSQGGAFAVAVSAMLLKAGMVPAAVVTFGQPRVFTGKEVARLFDGEGVSLTRYVHGVDPVPRVPAAPWWRHFGREVRIGKPFSWAEPQRLWRDHFMREGYLPAVEEWMARRSAAGA